VGSTPSHTPYLGNMSKEKSAPIYALGLQKRGAKFVAVRFVIGPDGKPGQMVDLGQPEQITFARYKLETHIDDVVDGVRSGR